MNIELNTILEVLGVLFNLLYLIFIIRENIICWVFGIIGSLISIWLFYRIGLYSESILYIYYVLIGFYGWYLWRKPNDGTEELHIHKWFPKNHIITLSVGVVIGYLMGYIFDEYTDAQNAYLDAYTTTFSFIASYMEAKKVLSSWVYWIIINGVTIWLYTSRGLDIYTLLTVVYFIMSFVGLRDWNNRYKKLQGVV